MIFRHVIFLLCYIMFSNVMTYIMCVCLCVFVCVFVYVCVCYRLLLDCKVFILC